MAGATQKSRDGPDRKILGARLRDARKYLGLTQEDVALRLGIPRTALSDIENGQRRVEALELTQMARLYGRPAGEFTGDDPVGSALPADVAHIARQAANLSPRDREELERFAEYLRARARLPGE